MWKSSKFLVVFQCCLLLLGVVYADSSSSSESDEKKDISKPVPDDLAEFMKDCNVTFPVDEAIAKEFNNSGSLPDETFRTPKCFMECLLSKCEIFNEDNDLDVELTETYFAGWRNGKRVTDLKEIAMDCKNRTIVSAQEDRCEKAYKYLQCIMEEEITRYGSDGFADW